MSEERFENAVRSMLRASAPTVVPVSLEIRAATLPLEPPAMPRWGRSVRPLGRLASGLAAAIAIAAIVGAGALLRLSSQGPAALSGRPIEVSSAFGSLRAGNFAVSSGSFTFSAPGGWTSSSFSGSPPFGSLELRWTEQARPMTLVAYFAADARDWWVSEIVVSEGRSDGRGWLYFPGPLFERPLGDGFDGAVTLSSSRSTDGRSAVLQFGSLELRAFLDAPVTKAPSQGTMPPPTSGGTIDENQVPDFVSVADQSGGVAGYAPKRLLLNPGPTNGPAGDEPDVPVFGPDLKEIVGYSIAGRGFVSLRDATATGAAAQTQMPSSQTLNPGELELSTTTQPVPATTTLDGLLGGEAQGSRACFWLEPSNAPGTRVALVWPAGYHAYAGPLLSINAPDYRVIAVTGARLSVSGTMADASVVSVPERCGLGSAFYVSAVVSAASVSPTPTH
jgi:hypothetical protein